jgi:hypothetical protein
MLRPGASTVPGFAAPTLSLPGARRAECVMLTRESAWLRPVLAPVHVQSLRLVDMNNCSTYQNIRATEAKSSSAAATWLSSG